MKLAIYARVSLPTKERDKVTQELKFKQEVDNQLLPLRKYVESRSSEGWVLHKEYIDRVSGKTSDRTEFEHLFRDAAKHLFDTVLFWSLDRFSREGVLETLTHLKTLNDYGVKWKSYTEQYVDSVGPFGDAIIAMLAAIAKQERIRISERTIAGLARARLQGRVGGRPRLITNRAEIIEAFKSKVSISQIAKRHKISRISVYRIIRGEDAHTKEMREK